jgi:agmatine deiminase
LSKYILPSPLQDSDALFMPAEWEPHEFCAMSFCAAKGLLSETQIDEVRFEQARVAQAIAAFEPVLMLTNAEDVEEARELCLPQIDIIEMEHYDIWTRDTLPTISLDRANHQTAICWNFNAWGEKLEGYEADCDLAGRFAAWRLLPAIEADIVAEGGAFDVDGRGTLITTESCLLGRNRNSGLSIEEIDQTLRRLTGARKVIWLPGAEVGVTDGHVDGMARFVGPGVIVADASDDPLDPEYKGLLENAKALRSATDCSGRPIEIIFLKRPRWEIIGAVGDDFSASYVNCYFANNAVVLPRYGDPIRDNEARELFHRLMPNRKVIQLDVQLMSENGGGLHCVTQQMPHPRARR